MGNEEKNESGKSTPGSDEQYFTPVDAADADELDEVLKAAGLEGVGDDLRRLFETGEVPEDIADGVAAGMAVLRAAVEEAAEDPDAPPEVIELRDDLREGMNDSSETRRDELEGE